MVNVVDKFENKIFIKNGYRQTLKNNIVHTFLSINLHVLVYECKYIFI